MLKLHLLTGITLLVMSCIKKVTKKSNQTALIYMGSAAFLESHLLCQFIQHACADCCSVGAEDVLLSLLYLPVILVPTRQMIKCNEMQ